jgi:carbohydrate binding protein with CBM4/9 domain
MLRMGTLEGYPRGCNVKEGARGAVRPEVVRRRFSVSERALGSSPARPLQRVTPVALAAVLLAASSGCAPDFGSLSSGAAIGGDSGTGGAAPGGAGGSAGDASGGTGGTGDLGGSTGNGDDAGTGGSAPAGNLIVNGAFDDGPSRWIGVGNPTLTLSSTTAHSPERCLWTSNRTQTWEGPGYPLTGLVEPGHQYVVNLWARAEADTLSANLTVKARCPDETADSYTPLTYFSLTTEWLEVTGSFAAPTCAGSAATVYLEAAPATGNFYIDDTSIELVQ